MTGIAGGSLGDMLKAGIITGATALAFYEVGTLFNTNGLTLSSLNAQNAPIFAANIAGRAAVGCVSSVASGGSCEAGALAAGAGSAAAPLVAEQFPNARTDLGQRLEATGVSGLVGGLASLAGGGKFMDGAVTAAFGYLFNQGLHGLPDQPHFDTSDSVILGPGDSPAATTSFQRTLTYNLDDDSQYAAGVTIVNEDNGLGASVDRLLRGLFGGNPVDVGFQAKIVTANGTTDSSFRITGNLPVYGWMSVPWATFGPLQGPGSVTITATNHVPFYTGVVVGASRISPNW
jgi:hypothetical protein